MSEQAHKHHRVARILSREIRRGTLPDGSRLPGEHALTERFSVSRSTVRAALRSLADEGLVRTHPGIGSFVSFDGAPLDNRHGWKQALTEQGGVTPSTTVLRLEAVRDRALGAELGLASDRFLAVDRMRSLADGARVSLERSRVPLAPGLEEVPRTGLVDGSLTATLAAVGLVVASGEQRATAVPLDAADAAQLQRPEGTSFLRVTRIGRAPAGAVLEHVVSLLDPARFELRTSFGEPH
ncbi:GntR family transcriptional regulator [Streptomyces reniochalinae]|uniref:GntR family transcriptional regulator n=1 Tax=Streptomyces reniochalinae TaxID=2250578 RepID=A0A367EFI8_9ACTN|nr:GntR family transcriptional regulator [Streptomyces reniochalinae]RCG16492.1 GntR family transcriptional regulator [Streptomyces reniochalinae]